MAKDFMKTDLQYHQIFLKNLQAQHKELLADLERIKKAIIDSQDLIEYEQDYIAKGTPCAESK